MSVKIADSFSVSSDSRLIERQHFSTSIVWEIAQVKRRFRGPGDNIISPYFQCFNVSWQLTAFLEGVSHGEPAALCLSCNALASTFNYLAYIRFEISNDRGKKEYELIGGKYTFNSRGSSEKIFLNIPASRVSSINTSGLTISFHICVEEDSIPVFCSEQASRGGKNEKKPGSCLNLLSSDFEELYNSAQFSDVTLKLGEEEFKAHKSVLSARSTVFAAMFGHDMKENRLGIVNLEDMEVETVRVMLRYLYCGRVRVLSFEEALSLYVAADLYELKELRTYCREVILLDISVNNVCDIAEVAELHDDELLIRKLKSFLLKNGKEIIKTKKWRAICAKNSVLCGKMFEWAFSE